MKWYVEAPGFPFDSRCLSPPLRLFLFHSEPFLGQTSESISQLACSHDQGPQQLPTGVGTGELDSTKADVGEVPSSPPRKGTSCRCG